MEQQKKQIDRGSVLSAAGLVLYFVFRGAGAPLLLSALAGAAFAVLSLAVLAQMLRCRKCEGKDALSGNRIAGQAALTLLLVMGAAAALREGGLLPV